MLTQKFSPADPIIGDYDLFSKERFLEKRSKINYRDILNEIVFDDPKYHNPIYEWKINRSKPPSRPKYSLAPRCHFTRRQLKDFLFKMAIAKQTGFTNYNVNICGEDKWKWI
ncbi:unnamed protein product [Gordionus sp. m RMFG-2023]